MPILTVMATLTLDARTTEQVQTRLDALREHFDRYFDRGWLAIVIDDLPIDSSLMRRIRELVSLGTVYLEDLPDIAYGIGQLRLLIAELRRHLLPVIRDRLGVSGFAASRSGRSADERVHRELLCMTFPHNLDRLDELTTALERALNAVSHRARR